MNGIKNEILQESMRIKESSLYLAKKHYQTAQHWTNIYYGVGIPTTVIAAITSAFALSDYQFIAGGLAVIISIMTALTTFLNPSGKANSHYNAMNNYKALADDISVFINVDSIIEDSEKILTYKLREFDLKYRDLNINSPIIPNYINKKNEKENNSYPCHIEDKCN